MKRRLTRRDFIKYGAVGLGSLALGSSGLYSLVSQRVSSARADDVHRSPFTFTPFTVDLPVPPVVQPVTTPFTPQCNLSSGSIFKPIPGLGTPTLYEIHMRKQTVQIIPGVDTEIWGTSSVLKPDMLTVSWYKPLARSRNKNVPASVDVDSLVNPVF